MRNVRKILLVLGGAAAAVVLFVVLRPEGEGDKRTAPPPTTTVPRTATTTARTDTQTPPAPEPVEIRIQVRGGRPLGGIKRVRVDRGDSVVLVVGSDEADHVHVHGYDIFWDVAPGRPARLTFRARLAGRFEIELEDRHLLIAELLVRP